MRRFWKDSYYINKRSLFWTCCIVSFVNRCTSIGKRIFSTLGNHFGASSMPLLNRISRSVSECFVMSTFIHLFFMNYWYICNIREYCWYFKLSFCEIVHHSCFSIHITSEILNIWMDEHFPEYSFAVSGYFDKIPSIFHPNDSHNHISRFW